MSRIALVAASLALVAPAIAGAQAPRTQPPAAARPAAAQAPAPRTPAPARPQGAQPSTPPAAQPAAQPAAPLAPVTGAIAPDVIAGRAWTAGKAPGPRVTLSQAVDLVLKYQPRLALSSQDVRTARAQLQQARGVFDPVLTFAPGGDYTQQPAAPGFLRQQQNNRTLLQELYKGFTRANIQLRDILADTTQPLPRCPLDFGFDFGASAFTVDRVDPGEQAATGLTRDSFPFVNVDLQELVQGVDLRRFCNSGLGSDPLDAILFDLSYGRLVKIDQGRPFGLNGVLDSGVEAPFEAVRLLAEISEAIATRAKIALDRLGPMPQDQFTRHITLQAGLDKPFRNGLVANFDVLLESEENNFRDKTMDPSFGGAGFPPRFPSSLTFGLLVPLGKGRGSEGTAAQERAARFTLAARQEQQRQVATEEIYRTLLAYIRVIAAQENVRLVNESVGRTQQLFDQVGKLVTGGELARIEQTRSQARAASVRASASSANAELIDARMSLAEAMGLDAGGLAEAPEAADHFADVRVDAESVTALIAAALESRRDLLALDQARRASSELARGARADTRRTYDLNLSTGIAQAYESENFRFLPDERNPIFSELNPPKQFDAAHRFYSPAGFWQGLTGRWEPFVTASISFDIPFGNNAAKGRLAQAQATLRSSDIQYGDRRRLIGDNITGVIGSLRTAAEDVLRAREALDRSRASFEGIRSQLANGEATVIDTLTTEEDLTRDEAEVVRAQQVYLSTLARLRFESGQLVTFSGLGDSSESARFVPTEFVVR
jgi:outer membrane protein TolC